MKRPAAMTAAFLFANALLFSAWSAGEIFLCGRFDPKFGRPLDSFLLGIHLGLLAAPLLGVGFFLAMFGFRSDLATVARRTAYGACSAVAVPTCALLGSGGVLDLFSWLPVGRGIPLHLSLVGTGLVAGLVVVALIRWLDQPSGPT